MLSPRLASGEDRRQLVIVCDPGRNRRRRTAERARLPSRLRNGLNRKSFVSQVLQSSLILPDTHPSGRDSPKLPTMQWVMEWRVMGDG